MSVIAEELSHEELVQTYYQHQATIGQHQATIESLTFQNEWLKRALFGQKTERLIHEEENSKQLALGEGFVPQDDPPPKKQPVKSYERSHRKDEVEFAEDESRLKFDDSVPVEVVEVPNPAIEDLSCDEYEVIGEEVSHKLAQRPGAYVVLKYVRKKVKVKESGELVTSALPPAASVIERSLAEVSFLVGLLLDKFQYHLPLYRQHQRLTASGVHVNRMTLTNLVHRAGQLLEPIYCSLQSSILLSRVLALDETPLKAGRKVAGKMHTGYLWGLFGDQNELAFLYSSSRSGRILREALSSYEGTILTDGYRVYERFAQAREEVIHAQCWAHTRRKFFEAQDCEPKLAARALALIGKLYQLEKEGTRDKNAQEAVDEFFSWLSTVFCEQALLPSNPFTKAAAYALKREQALRVFVNNPKVQLDTNHLERQIRPVTVGRKNWLFHWTEVGAEYGAIIQSLIATCRLQEVEPYTYFVDVLQRVSTHPMREIHLLTPREWKQNYNHTPIKSDLRHVKNGGQ